MTSALHDLLVPARFCGPPVSGNGGWTCGAMAHLLHEHLADPAAAPVTSWAAVTVTLRRPPPLDVAVPAAEHDGVVSAADEAGVVAEAVLADRPLLEVAPVDPATAAAAEASYAGRVTHPFTTCFTCGPDREVGDGLRIFPGPVAAAGAAAGTLVAATWVPHPSTAEDWHQYDDDHQRASLPVTWAALDCPGGWAADLAVNPAVLGRMTARVDALPQIGEEHVVVGHFRGRDGRKLHTASTLYDSDGRIVATAEHTWVTVDAAQFR